MTRHQVALTCSLCVRRRVKLCGDREENQPKCLKGPPFRDEMKRGFIFFTELICISYNIYNMHVLLCIRNEVIWEEINSPCFKLASSSAGGKMVGSLRDRTWQIEGAQ